MPHPHYDVIHRTPLLLASIGRGKIHYTCPWSTRHGSISLPTMFEPRAVRFPNRMQALLVDACLFAKNPTELATRRRASCTIRAPDEDTASFTRTAGYPRAQATTALAQPRLAQEYARNCHERLVDLVHTLQEDVTIPWGFDTAISAIDLKSERLRGRQSRVTTPTPKP